MNTILRQSKITQIKSDLDTLIAKYGQQILAQALQDYSNVRTENKPSVINVDISLQEASDYFLISPYYQHLLSESTKISYKSELTLYLSYVTEHNPNRASLLSAMQSDVFLGYIRNYEKNTKAKKCAFLRTFFKTVHLYYFEKPLDTRILELLPVITERNSHPRSFTKIQMAELINLAQSDNLGYRNYAILWTLFESGIRLNELRNLTIEDIDSETETLQVIAKRKPKIDGPKKVTRHITKLGLLILTEYVEFKYKMPLESAKKECGQCFVFSKNKGKTALSGRTIEKIIDSLIERCLSIPDSDKHWYSTHSTRHTFAMNGLDSGLDVYTISKLLGHSSIKSTEVYLILRDEQLKEAINSLSLAKEELSKIQMRLRQI